MLELVMAVCIVGDPAHCKDVSLTFTDDETTPIQCMMGTGAQSEIARWLEAHPKWEVKRWKCAPAGTLAKV